MLRTIKYLLMVVCILGLATFIFVKLFPQVQYLFAYRVLTKKLAFNSLDITPNEHTVNKPAEPVVGTTYTFDNVSITTGWKKIRQLQSDNKLIFQFEGNKGIIIHNKEDIAYMYPLFSKETYQNYGSAMKELGITDKKTTFEFMMNTVENDLNLSTPVNKAQVYLLTLTTKNLMVGESDQILTYRANGYTFYQVGPQKNRNIIDLYFFDKKNEMYWITIVNVSPPQENIDSLVKTVKVI